MFTCCLMHKKILHAFIYKIFVTMTWKIDTNKRNLFRSLKIAYLKSIFVLFLVYKTIIYCLVHKTFYSLFDCKTLFPFSSFILLLFQCLTKATFILYTILIQFIYFNILLLCLLNLLLLYEQSKLIYFPVAASLTKIYQIN